MKNSKTLTAVIHIIFVIMTLSFLVPFALIIIISFTKEADLVDYGFSLIPRHWSVDAYSTLFKSGKDLLRSGLWTIFIAIVQPAISAVVSATCAYALFRDDFSLKKPIQYILIGTMMFGAGLVPTYIVYTNVYGLGNNPLIYFVTGLTSCWSIILYRTFFQGIPSALIESAYIDGATQPKVLWYIVLPMSKAIFGIQYFQGMLGQWGNYQTALIYLTSTTMKPWWTIQYYLQEILTNNQVMIEGAKLAGLSPADIPLTTLKYAMCVIAVVPIMMIFPYVQKYFSKGMAVGSVKG